MPLDLFDPAERPVHQMLYDRARTSGTPFVSFDGPDDIMALSREAVSTPHAACPTTISTRTTSSAYRMSWTCREARRS
ncbi:hypothetical protein [Dyella sp. EPa41]|uniref:hypothetical protein n=1 Tax=Dyella sp. EPa41 TaxID=1561194 RepID=UPI00191587D9|nr:hypothetical protein [Dyella sp. EPa41]